MDKLKKYVIVLDGIDKTGKDTILRYIFELSNKKYICIARGLQSMIAYNNIFNRPFEYDFEKERNGPAVNIYLTVNEEDWKIRCKLTGEPKIDFYEHSTAFSKAARLMNKNKIPIYSFNTSLDSPFVIAQRIISIVDSINKNEV